MAPQGPQGEKDAVQEPLTQEALIARREAKRALPVFKKANWTFDYDEAQERAAAEGKLILAYFTRSYRRCNPCTRLEKRALSDSEITALGEDLVLYCHITSMVEGDPHQSLLKEKGGHAFPYLVFLKADGSVLASLRPRHVVDIRRRHAACVKFLELESKAEGNQEKFVADLFIARLEMGSVSFEQAQKEAAELPATPAAKQARIAELLVGLEVSNTMRNVGSRTEVAEAGRRFAKMWKEGRAPKGRMVETFYFVIMEAAEADLDPKLFARALSELERVARKGASRERVIQRMRNRLEALKKKAGKKKGKGVGDLAGKGR